MSTTAAGPTAPRARSLPVLFAVPAFGALILLVLPLLGLLARAPWGDIGRILADPTVVQALRVSVISSTGALVVCLVCGVPLAWFLARVDFPGRSLVRGFVLVPMVLPPVVGGVALLLAFGPRGLLGGPLDRLGITLPFSTAGTVMAATYVALPFLVLAVEGALESVDRAAEEVAETLGASPWRVFWTITLPSIRPGLASGAALAWARALGEFGATITFAGSIAGITQTMPLAVYEVLPTDPAGALTLSLLMLVTSTTVIVALRSQWLVPWRARRAP
ncbi:MAG TPA: ABC transporter permease [Actinomycetes bacterium]|nr:ABC transporter permease [Actinomycetes bacterium]